MPGRTRLRRAGLVLRILCVFATGLVSWLVAPSTRAQSTLRVAVHVGTPENDALWQRLQGHTSDLPVALQRRPLSPAASTEELRSAIRRALAGSEQHDVEVWFESASTPGRYWLVLCSIREGRVLLQELVAGTAGTAGPERTLSPMAESAALIVRSALALLAIGGEVGVLPPSLKLDASSSRTTGPRPGEPPPSTSHSPAGNRTPVPGVGAPPDGSSTANASAKRRPAASVEPRAAASTQPGHAAAHGIQASVTAGVLHSLDGSARLGHPGLWLTLGAEHDTHTLELYGSLGLSAEHRASFATLRLRRHLAGLGWSVDFWQKGRWALRGGLRAGAWLLERATVSPAAGTRAAADSLNAAPWAASHVDLRLGLGGLRLILSLGVDGVFSPTRLVVSQGDGQRGVTRPWHAQPWLALGLGWRSP